MTFARLRLWAAVVVLLAWLGYLGHQALSISRFSTVVSHAQLLVSTLDVIADLRAGDDGKPVAKVKVTDVRWPAGLQALTGREIEVINLADASGFTGAGSYVVPLVDGEGGTYRVAPLPRSPGFDRAVPLYLIYPDTPLTRRQLESIPKPASASPLASNVQ
jgi:hypothetical protein